MAELTIEEAFAALDTACGQRMKLDKPAARALMVTVLEDTYHLAGHFRMNAIGTCLCGACKARARIAALGGKMI